jgi:hypothetical protein
MKKVLRWVVAVCALLLLLFGVGLYFKNPILKKITEARIRRETGLPAAIGSLDVALRSGTVTVRDFKILNAPEFGGTALLNIPEVHLALDSQGAAEGKLHFTEVRFHLADVNVVRGTNGELNLESLQKRHRSKKEPRQEKGSKREFEFGGIDKLYLSLGTIRYTDLQNPKLSDEHVLGVENELIENIKTEEELQAHLLRILVRAALQEVLNPAEKPKRRWLGGLLETLRN